MPLIFFILVQLIFGCHWLLHVFIVVPDFVDISVVLVFARLAVVAVCCLTQPAGQVVVILWHYLV
jgi:hypothetical protein